jgi:hypothetical protein
LGENTQRPDHLHFSPDLETFHKDCGTRRSHAYMAKANLENETGSRTGGLANEVEHVCNCFRVVGDPSTTQMRRYPGLTTLTLLYCIAFWSITAGIAEIIAAIRLRAEIEGEWLLGLAGAISVLFGIFLIASPGAGALGLILVIASYAFVAGIVLVGLGMKLRSFRRSVRAAVA